MTWEIYIRSDHPALAEDRLSLTRIEADAEEERTITFRLTGPGFLRINTKDIAAVVTELQLYVPAHPIAKVVQATDAAVATELPVTVVKRPLVAEESAL